MDDRDGEFLSVRREYERTFGQVFSSAFNRDAFAVICTVLRVGGMQDAHWDPFEETLDALNDCDWLLVKGREERGAKCALRVALLIYCQLVEMNAAHEILANLLRIAEGKTYVVAPFHELVIRRKKGQVIPPTAKAKVRRIRELAESLGQSALVEALDRFFDEDIRNAFSHSDYIIHPTGEFRYRKDGIATKMEYGELDGKLTHCFAFYSALLASHGYWRQSLARMPRLHPWPNYEVLELLTRPDIGLHGFCVHFSNGNKATYSRSPEGTEATNIGFEGEGEPYFHVGNLDELGPRWMVDGKVLTFFAPNRYLKRRANQMRVRKIRQSGRR